MHLARSRTRVVRGLVGGAVALGAWAAASMQGGAGAASPGGASAAPTWAHYFYPLKVGWTCHESLDTGGVTGSATLQVAAVTRVAGGRAVTVDEGSSTSTGGGQTTPTNAALHYVLTNGGQLVSQPSAAQVVGQSAQIVGNTTFPTVRALLSGRTSVSYLRLAVTLPASTLSQLQGALTPGQTGLDATIGLRERGASAATLTTAMGTFHRVLVVHSTMSSFKVTNALQAAAGTLDTQLEPILAKEFDITTWYAPGVGPVKITLDGLTAAMTSCGLGPTGSS